MGEHMARYTSFGCRIYYLHPKMYSPVNRSIKAQLVQRNSPIQREQEPELGRAGLRMTLLCLYFAFPWEKKSFQSSFLSGRRLVHNLVSEHLFPSLGLVLKEDDNALLKAHQLNESLSESECFLWEIFINMMKLWDFLQFAPMNKQKLTCPVFRVCDSFVLNSYCVFVWLGFFVSNKVRKIFFKHREVVEKITLLEIALCMVIVVFNHGTPLHAAQCRAGLGMHQELNLFQNTDTELRIRRGTKGRGVTICKEHCPGNWGLVLTYPLRL